MGKKLRASNKMVSVASIRALKRDKEDEQKARRRSQSYVEHFLRNPTKSQPKDRMRSRKSILLDALRKREVKYNHAALLVIDVQKYFFDRGEPTFIKGTPKIKPNILKLIDAFHAAKLPVVFTRIEYEKGSDTGQMGRWWGDWLPWKGKESANLIDEIRPKTGDLCISKKRYSAFERTRLKTWLTKRGVDTVAVCGVMTGLCVDTTARDAFMKDFWVVIVKDACAAKRKKLHDAAISNLAYGVAVIETTKKVIKNLWTSSIA